MEIHNSNFGRCPRVCGYRAEKPRAQTKDSDGEPFERKPIVIEPAHERVGFHLTTVFNITYGDWMPLPKDHDIPQGFTISKQCYDYRMATRISIPLYPVFFPNAQATFRKCWELREEQSESDDGYRDAMRAHYQRVAPKVEVTYKDVPEECLRPDPYNFYQRKQLCDGAKAVPRFYEDDYTRMFKAEHYKGNPQHQDDFDYSDVEEHEVEIDYLGIPPQSKGINKNEKVYWIGQIYLINLRNGRRKTGALEDTIAKYFNIVYSTVRKYYKYADACNILAEDGDGSIIARNNTGTIPKIMRVASVVSVKDFDWVLKPFDYKKRSRPWETFDGERGYAAKEAALRL